MSEVLLGDLPSEVRDIAADNERDRHVTEPLVYRLKGEWSYFADVALAVRDNTGAQDRLERHSRQMADVPRETRSHPDQEAEYRVNPNTNAGTGGDFAPPLWLNRLFATQKRTGQVIQRLVGEFGNEFDLPPGAGSINLPKFKVGVEVNDQNPGSPAIDLEGIETVAVKAQTLTYSGASDWSIQALEQSPQGAHLDWVVFKDATESLDGELEADFINGKGEAFGELIGLLNMSGTNKIENTGAVEAKVIFPELGKAMAKVGIERKMPPDAWLMGTARLAWLAMAVDGTEQRPLILTDNIGQEWPPASMAGVAVYLDDAITRSYEAKEQEPVFCVRAKDFMLWHSPIRTMVLQDVLSGSMGVRFVLYRSTATMLHRHPSGISLVVGAGMKTPTGF